MFGLNKLGLGGLGSNSMALIKCGSSAAAATAAASAAAAAADGGDPGGGGGGNSIPLAPINTPPELPKNAARKAGVPGAFPRGIFGNDFSV